MSENASNAKEENGGGKVHALPARLLILVWAILLALTVATVAATRVDLGGLNLWVAMLIATAKAGLVALYFMHLRYEKPLLGIVFACAILFVMLFVSITLMDTLQYGKDLIPGYAPGLENR